MLAIPTNPADLSARQARRLMGSRQLSPVELLDACLARIAARNPAVNAIVATDEAGARAAARTAEAAIMAAASTGAPLPLLHGLPVGIKDLNETAGLKTTFGCLAFKDHVPAKDDPIVARIRAAGGIVLAKTNTPEFGAGANTRNAVYGATGNPFNPTLTPAGSSGGSAVALALAMLPLAAGSDHGGSLRTPAAYCGVTGYRPSPGLVPQPHVSALFNPLPVEGPMGRDVADLCLLLAAMAGHDPSDPYSRPGGRADFGLGPDGLPPAIDLSTLRVAVSEDLGVAPVDDEVRATFRAKIAAIAPLFGRVEPVDPPLAGADEVFDVLRAVQFAAGLASLVETRADLLGPNVLANMERARGLSLMEVGRAQKRHSEIIRKMAAFHRDHDLLICPAAAVRPFPHETWFPAMVGGRPSRSYFDWITITAALSVTTQPVLCLPAGRDSDGPHGGMPFGLQVTAARGRDGFLLGAGLALETALQGMADLARPIPPAL